MNSSTPPDRLNELAERLGRRCIAPLSPGLAARVGQAVAAELRSRRSKRDGPSWAAFAAGLAAAFVMGATVSLIAVSDTRAAATRSDDPARVRATARAIRDVAPELSEADALRISILDDARSSFVCIPRPQTNDPRSARSALAANGETP